jgi:hypothetical protein
MHQGATEGEAVVVEEVSGEEDVEAAGVVVVMGPPLVAESTSEIFRGTASGRYGTKILMCLNARPGRCYSVV